MNIFGEIKFIKNSQFERTSDVKSYLLKDKMGMIIPRNSKARKINIKIKKRISNMNFSTENNQNIDGYFARYYWKLGKVVTYLSLIPETHIK